MPRIRFRAADGSEHTVEAEPGYTLMEAAQDHDVPGMLAECGGACACATCHIYVDSAWLPSLPPLDDMEDAMLDAAQDRTPESRLGCQIEITSDLDGIRVTVADNASG